MFLGGVVSGDERQTLTNFRPGTSKVLVLFSKCWDLPPAKSLVICLRVRSRIPWDENHQTHYHLFGDVLTLATQANPTYLD